MVSWEKHSLESVEYVVGRSIDFFATYSSTRFEVIFRSYFQRKYLIKFEQKNIEKRADNRYFESIKTDQVNKYFFTLRLRNG